MQERHIDRKQYFKEQAYTSDKYILSFIRDFVKLDKNLSVLEIGCGEGGNLKPFVDLGCARVVGVDLAKQKLENARKFYADHPNSENVNFVFSDIYKVEDLGQFDFVFMRDVLEHIHDQEEFMTYVKRFLKPNGKFYLGFPPWVNPFGGHQQICRSKLSMLPYIHLLPKPLFKLLLRVFNETPSTINSLMENTQTKISIQRFERIIKKAGYVKNKRWFYFINPNYEVKFNLKPRKLNRVLASIPVLRDFFITTNYYLLSLNNKS